MKKRFPTGLLLLAVMLGTALSPALLDLAATAQQALGARASIATALTAELTPLYSLEGHTGGVIAAAFSPDSLQLAAAGSGGSVWLWNTTDGSLTAVLEGHTDTVQALAFSPDGARLATGGNDRTVRIWDTAQGELVRTIRATLTGRTLALAYAPDGLRLTIAGNLCNVTLHLTSTGLLNQTLTLPLCGPRQGGGADFMALAYTADGSQLYIGAGQASRGRGAIYRWEAGSLRSPELFRGNNVAVRDLALAPSGESLAAAVVGSSSFDQYRASDRALMRTYTGHDHRVNSVAFAPEGGLLASAARDGTIRLWSERDGLLLRVLGGHSGAINAVAFAPEGSMLASGGADGRLLVWVLQE